MQPPSYMRENESMKEKKMLSQAESSQKMPEEYFYGFDGEKEIIVPPPANARKNYSFGGGKTLKTIYKIKEENKAEHKIRLSTNFSSGLAKMGSKATNRSTAKETHFKQRKDSGFMRLLQPSNCDEHKFKAMIETELKKTSHQPNLKWHFKLKG